MTQPVQDTALPKNKPLMATGSKSVCLVVQPPKKVEGERTVVVLGVERGGTSMVAGVVRALGIDLGRRAGLNHEDPRFLNDDEGHLRHVIAVRDKENAVWGFKMPKAVFHLDLLESTLRNPYYVIVHRNLAAIADSWQQRGAGSYIDTLDRALDYHTRLNAHCRKTNRPVMLVNYERAAKDPATMVEDLVDFLGLQPEPEDKRRAEGMVTGDGSGYVNLPEHFFTVTPCTDMPARPLLATTDNAAEVTTPDGWVSFDTLKVKQVYAPADGGRLPADFWVKLTLDAPADLDLSTNPVRLYFDFIGEMFPGHCARPALRRGDNLLFVETSGNASALGIGPLEAGTRLRLSAQLYQASETDDLAVPAASTVPPAAEAPRGLLARLRRLMR